MSSTLLVLIAGCTVFALTTFASLWVGYLLMQARWVAENPELASDEDAIRPLFSSAYPQQRTSATVEDGWPRRA